MPAPAALAVLDLVPVSSGSGPRAAVADSLRLARAAEAAGYARYWFAEHHLNPGVVGSAPALTIALAGAVTERIRLGSGAVLTGNRTPLSIAEEFALLEAAYPGRIDLGLGRSNHRASRASAAVRGTPPPPRTEDVVTAEGLLLPPPVSLAALLESPRVLASLDLQGFPGAEPPTYAETVSVIQDAFAGRLAADGVAFPEAVAVDGGVPQVWVLGSSAGESSALAGARGLRFGANYHVAPSSVVDAVAHYRESFTPSADLAEPYVTVSADVVVAPTREEAEHLAAGYGHWVHSIRSGAGAIPYPTPEGALARPLEESERALVDDRLRTRFVGSADEVADRLAVLQRATGADELLVTSVTHDPALRVRSHALLAQAWGSTG